MSNEQLQVGDRVELIDLLPLSGERLPYLESPQQGLVIGNTGTVVAVVDEARVRVRTDNAENPAGVFGDGWTLAPESLRKLP